MGFDKRKFITVMPLFALGLTVAGLLSFNITEPMQFLSKQCPNAAPHFPRSGVAPIDYFLCGTISVFKNALFNENGVWALGYLLSLYLACFEFIAVESSRYGTPWILSFPPIFMAITQAFGVLLTFPLVWLPVYFLLDVGDRSPSNLWKKKISSTRVAAIAVALIPMELLFLSVFFPFPDEKVKEIFLWLFLLSPVFIPFIWLPFQTAKTSRQDWGHHAVIALLVFQAGVMMLWHLLALLYLVNDSNLFWRVLDLLWHHPPGYLWSQYFMVIDALGVYAALLCLVWMEDGFYAAMLTFMGSFVVGPASAVFLYMAKREQLISKDVTALTEEKKSS